MMNRKARILYVEDDATLSYITRENLERKGYQVIHCADGKKALELFDSTGFDLCILDIMIPGIDGFAVARRIREINKDIPLLFVTAKSLQEDKIEGLLIGADDYIIKPFSFEELILKIKIFLKRSNRSQDSLSIQEEIYRIGAFTFDFANLVLKNAHKEIKLTYREGELLKLFILNRNKLISREEILVRLWGENDYFAGRSLDVFVSRLRKYLRADGTIKIENRHGVGYMLQVKKSGRGLHS
ncbi:MAG: response regulator transcription factor [Bacteroidales bacterium]|nr:MAG: response regulator transcription factor [Bacteroidales bacterium]